MDILALLQPIQAAIPQTTFRQMSRIIFAMLAMTGRVTMLGLSRWAGAGGNHQAQAGRQVVEQKGDPFVDRRVRNDLVIIQHQADGKAALNQLIDRDCQNSLRRRRRERLKQKVRLVAKSGDGFLQGGYQVSQETDQVVIPFVQG